MRTTLIKYCHSAKRTALIAQDNLTKKWYHIFSVIELLPAEIPPYNIPTKDWYKDNKHPASSIIRSKLSEGSFTHNFYLLIQNIANAETAFIEFDDPIKKNIFDGQEVQYFNTSFVKEPTGEAPLVLAFNDDDSGINAVLPKRRSGMLIWTQIDNERKVEKMFQHETISKEMKAMSQLTTDWLGFDIWSKPEHIGNIYLSAPNPYFRGIDISLSSNPKGIFYQFKLRKGINEKLQMRIVDRHGEYVALDKIVDITAPMGLIELPHEPSMIELSFFNKRKELIAIQKPAGFIKTLNIGISMKQADFHVKVLDKVGGSKEFTVEKYSKEQPIKIGKESQFNAPYYFKNAENNRKHITLARNKEFLFFPGGKSEQEKRNLKTTAKETIREIINGAKEECFLCDPYFNVTDLIEYAFYIKNSGIKINILNAKGNNFISKEKAKELFDAISEYNTKPFQSIECRLLRGDSILHDRFIVSDLNVWFLGSSFSEFGNRATCIGKVPESANIEIIKKIENWYYNEEFTQSISDYINSAE